MTEQLHDPNLDPTIDPQIAAETWTVVEGMQGVLPEEADEAAYGYLQQANAALESEDPQSYALAAMVVGSQARGVAEDPFVLREAAAVVENPAY